MSKLILIPVAPGELIDKITILEIRLDCLEDASRRESVMKELDLLRAAQTEMLSPQESVEELGKLSRELKEINSQLWVIEDDIRACERDQRFDAEFVRLARAVYQTNDKRSDVKRQINTVLKSDIREEKSYTAY